MVFSGPVLVLDQLNFRQIHRRVHGLESVLVQFVGVLFKKSFCIENMHLLEDTYQGPQIRVVEHMAIIINNERVAIYSQLQRFPLLVIKIMSWQ